MAFQSSPALSSGRYHPRVWRAAPRARFNPRPPFRAGATVSGASISSVQRGFNPRPPFRAGATGIRRCGLGMECVSILARPFERALHIHVCSEQLNYLVSILARPFERALLWPDKKLIRGIRFQSSPALSSGRYLCICNPNTPYFGFNPRPPFRAGATIADASNGAHVNVSILARPFERALRPRNMCRYSCMRFQSSPALSSGRYQ